MNESFRAELLHLLTVGELNARQAREQFAVCGEIARQAAEASPLLIANALPNGRMGVHGAPSAGQQLQAQARAMQDQANQALTRFIHTAGRLQGLVEAVNGGGEQAANAE